MRILLILPFFLFSCYTPKKAERQINKAYIKHNDMLLAKTRWWWPCVPMEVKRDSVKYIAFLQQLDTILKVDTINEKCPERQVLIKYREILKHPPAIHDTIKIKDMSCEAIRGDLTAQNSKLKDSIIKSQKWNLWLLIALCVSILLHFIRRK